MRRFRPEPVPPARSVGRSRHRDGFSAAGAGAFQRPGGIAASRAALTLRGRLTYRNRSPLETQFVCLLDRGERPLFFYALPALASRAAPTPSVGRVGQPVPQLSQPPVPSQQTTMALTPQPPPPPPAGEAARPSNATRLRGLVRDLGGRLQFVPCDGARSWIGGSHPGSGGGEDAARADGRSGGRPMFVEIYGTRESGAKPVSAS